MKHRRRMSSSEHVPALRSPSDRPSIFHHQPGSWVEGPAWSPLRGWGTNSITTIRHRPQLGACWNGTTFCRYSVDHRSYNFPRASCRQAPMLGDTDIDLLFIGQVLVAMACSGACRRSAPPDSRMPRRRSTCRMMMWQQEIPQNTILSTNRLR